MVDLSGKVAIVTGAAQGQGAAEARQFAACGARVVLTDVLESEGAAVAKELGEAALFVRHDVAESRDWDSTVAAALDTFGRVDVLVNNAALYRVRGLEEQTYEEFDRILRTNLLGAFLGMQAVLEPMRRAGGGAIVNIASQAGMEGIAGHAAYGSAKWGLRGLSRTAAVELGADGIRVNTVCPGAIDTAMTGHRGHEPGSHPTAPLGRRGTAAEVADLVTFLASEEASYLTGAEFPVDGGATAGRVGKA